MTFVPQRLAITNITQANPGVVTTSPAHGLTTGGVVRLHVPQNYGMVQLNQGQFSITVLSPTTFSLQFTQTPFVNVNTTNFTAFTIPSKPGFTAEVLSIGSGSTPITTTTQNITLGICATSIADATLNNSTTPQPY